ARSQPGDFPPLVRSSSIAPLTGARYPTRTADSLLVCQSQRSAPARDVPPTAGSLVKLTLTGPTFGQVTANDILVHDCKGAVAVGPDGTIYYANNTEIRKFENQQVPQQVPPSR